MMKVAMMLVLALLLAGCSRTSVKEEWKDPGYRGPGVRSVVVLVLPPDIEGNRTADEFVAQLGERGISAVAGYKAMPASAATREAVMEKARELGYEMVLVSSFLDRRRELDIYPRQGPSLIMMPGFDIWPSHELVENEYLVFATNLYQVASGKPIWSAVSDTFARGSTQKDLRSYVKAVLRKMERQGLLEREKG